MLMANGTIVNLIMKTLYIDLCSLRQVLITFSFIESVLVFAPSLCHTGVPHPNLFRAMDRETVYSCDALPL